MFTNQRFNSDIAVNFLPFYLAFIASVEGIWRTILALVGNQSYR